MPALFLKLKSDVYLGEKRNTEMAISKKTIIYQSLDKTSLFKLLSENQILLNNYALTLLDNLQFNFERKDSKIVVTELSLADLNFSIPVNYMEIAGAIVDFGFKHCPAGLAPYIRLAYTDQINSIKDSKNQHPPDSILIFSKPLSNKEDFPKGFYLRKIKNQLWLRGYICAEDYKWSSDTRIIVL
ncbi:hypothetical protein [Olivibacter domesticus]|uniref:Helicase n=1 Tax=Olivibacter domesticus TaxID=407022 RepID=A0A1H7MBQ2_OLID1|nr:hypothetical protein [Olivibacter domesticus]SEL08047.1 hypothetical protein SAMN05661044_01922 [Olivibacter domesticus]